MLFRPVDEAQVSSHITVTRKSASSSLAIARSVQREEVFLFFSLLFLSAFTI